MSLTVQEQINRILSDRQKILPEVREQKNYWDERTRELDRLATAVRDAECKKNSAELNGLGRRVDHVAAKAREMASKFAKIADRFSRNHICIGIGGAARMGKSTFLQSVTGLGEEEIPTSDKYFTTAGRSLIVNASEKVARARMHTEASFLDEVVAPMCSGLKIPVPLSIAELENMKLPGLEICKEQAMMDFRIRLADTKAMLPIIKPELTGERDKIIAIENLRDYVAYPEGGAVKAGKFMAVADITIYAPFPESAVRQLHVVDFPGLGEAGRDLAVIQTRGMSNICDITLLMKRPTESNVAWTYEDTLALDALKDSAPLIEDQTKYTVIIANDNTDRADSCIKNMQNQLGERNFEIIRCNAKDKVSVYRETMPKILDFLTGNLPEMDAAIFSRTKQDASAALTEIKTVLTEVKKNLSSARGLSLGAIDLKNRIYTGLLDDLGQYSRKLSDAADDVDQAWNDEVIKMAESVKKWIQTDCGFGSMANLANAFRKEFNKDPEARPRDTINAIRVAFRKQWSELDLHLEKRIAKVLMDFVDIIKKHTNAFIPPRSADTLAGVQRQLRDTADKLQNAPDLESGNDEARLEMLTEPLRRLSEFELRFRFHLEPLLIGATAAIKTANFPVPKGTPDEAEAYTGKIVEFLTKVTDIYSRAMQMTGSKGKTDPLGKVRSTLRETLKDDPAVCDALEAEIARAVGSGTVGQQFIPNKIFAAVIENATHAILLCDGAEDAFSVWARAYASELREEPTPAARAVSEAYAVCSGLLKRIQ